MPNLLVSNAHHMSDLATNQNGISLNGRSLSKKNEADEFGLNFSLDCINIPYTGIAV
jgi:hypothetical protein